MFVAASALLLALLFGRGVAGIVGSVLLLSWLFKYAYVLLEHVANGSLEAPAVSVEMIGPFEQRPLMQLAWCFLFYEAVRRIGGTPGLVFAAVLLLVLPASAAVLGMGLGILQSLNPLTLWRTVRGLGLLYPAILGVVAAAAFVLIGLQHIDAWNLWTFAAAELFVLTVFSAIGGALFERRLEVGHEPLDSPERRAERGNREHEHALNAMLDELYTQMRLKRRDSALKLLQRWLDDADAARLLPDAHTIVDRAAAWQDPIALQLVAKLLVAELLRCGDADGAQDISERLAALT